MINVIFTDKGKKLIKKYNKYYIRFLGGQYTELPCDLEIRQSEADEIIDGSVTINDVLTKYEKTTKWSFGHFEDTGLHDYMKYECRLSDLRIEKAIEKLNRQPDIKLEFYETVIYDSFPIESAIRVEGYTAEKLNASTYLSVMGAYNYLIYLREDPEHALEDLANGLPRK